MFLYNDLRFSITHVLSFPRHPSPCHPRGWLPPWLPATATDMDTRGSTPALLSQLAPCSFSKPLLHFCLHYTKHLCSQPANSTSIPSMCFQHPFSTLSMSQAPSCEANPLPFCINCPICSVTSCRTLFTPSHQGLGDHCVTKGD